MQHVAAHIGDATFYDVGLGSCGAYNVPTDFIAAVSHELYDTFPGYSGGNPNNNPICGGWATAFHNGRSIRFQVQDRCGGCAGFGDLDFSHSAFVALFGSLDAGRVHGVRWVLDSEGGPGPRPPSPPRRGCAKTYTAVSGKRSGSCPHAELQLCRRQLL
ncbi:hypothetical protein AURDEDRAFT_70891 [Auricularia subglabra TFB-10046 SS5]|uniref:Plant expansin n=1 Tax=Auricularia subglabra (strain TFB-10046 / SS5) TaxID=717982 RepID=J0WW69_AURST|nr:hypothetical protein AURDEDRAFT_70891 [Auricularia subglabra TFB-10046 SS5]